MYTAFFFWGGAADVFLSLMLWFILDSEKTASVLLDGERAYAVRDDIINRNNSAINEDCDLQVENQGDHEDLPARSYSFTTVSQQMID